MKKFLISTMVISSVIFTAACGSGDSNGEADGGDSEDSVTLRLAHTGSDTHQYHIAAEKFKELAEEKTDGSVTIDIHGNANLGSEDEAVEQILDGTLDMTTVAADSSFANTVPEMNVFGIPYIFEDRDHVYSVLDGEIGESLMETVEENNMKGLGFWEVGFRHITNNEKEINTPQDVQGLSIRVQPSKVWEAHMNALGASPTPVDFNELYSALDQGVVDGQENPLPTIDSMKFYEVQDYVTLTSHTYSPAITVASNAAWEKLSEDQQAALEEAVQETTDYQREELAEKEEEIVETLEENGVTINEEPDREAFREATADVRDVLSEEVPASLLEEIEAAK
ncbi:DctP family TRAP transporter solute-binding subunit [Alteribacillus sp. HJP-4]|uniref:DctP family TRAP transporter solute-binding subunit n=1 Tax=Alteribacillus sp. HJP-4 TaxID=2775394 RepID=UPI0035CCF607